MRPDEQAIADADARFTQWMRLNLDRAADHFGLTLTGQSVFGWRLRTIGAPAAGGEGPVWLRVVTEFPEWAHGDTWTGNTDANTLTGITKPQVIGVHEWDEQNWRRQRAEVLTLLPGTAISRTNQLRAAVDLPDAWWADLREGIDVLRATLTVRAYTTSGRVAQRTRATYGTELHVTEWETVHGDLHWENLLAPEFGLIDWELWGRGPAGMDAATLLLYSLLIPEVAERVYDTFADQLDTPAGRTAQLAVAARLLSRIADGDFPELADPIRAHVRRLGVIPVR
ncbi:MAG: phosphotransferase [Pseudonocardiales bacterium]|nr:phosphotransferase [Pseudonocardiales bacterium]